MSPIVLVPDAPDLCLEHVESPCQAFTFSLRTTAATASCPCCSQLSCHVHSRYARQAKDLPVQGHNATLRIVARKFFCHNPDCPRLVFCERLAQFLPAYARATARLTDAHRALGFALGGEAGSRLARLLAMPTSPDTLLRRIMQPADSPAPLPRIIGVDDWALRKGQCYGTIVTDLERAQVLELLPGRDGSELLAWLKKHPKIEVISRDRWAPFAQAIAEALPQAMQVADRWHLPKNLREAVERFFQRRYHTIKEILQPLTPTQLPTTPSSPPHEEQPVLSLHLLPRPCQPYSRHVPRPNRPKGSSGSTVTTMSATDTAKASRSALSPGK